MNRKQRMMDAVRAMASAELDRQLNLATTFTLAGCILAIDMASKDFDYDTWFKAFAEIYPNVLNDPQKYIKQAEEIAGGDIEIQWTK